ncbi:glycosyltransferase family 9 protein [Desulfocurvus vexinensis]|uniref:glycosyltransferase family 9 protein n=1 Tax=Desulfocurvus vexinensis TaxID=399548 RepID=UPI0004B24FDD|nr:glycosyltransferase family 9 protein [Desulfocurvus vexinensis]
MNAADRAQGDPGKAPILILQMQRMGDLVLSFPLMLWLTRRFPGHPVWTMAERLFSEHLLPVSPQVTYFPWEAASLAHLRAHRYHLVINLSHDPRAAELAGAVDAEEVYGPVRTPGGAAYVRGDWQLYRTSLVRANRHNRFHWADLNALDVIPLAEIAATGYSPPRTITAVARRKIGLFLGASQPEKRPEPAFWAALARELLARGLRPVLLGGPGEAAMGRAVAGEVPERVLNLCGTTSLSELVMIGQTLGLMVTPDTGPMHLAAWTGLPVLNLSMGNVNCWETGPYQPRHHVLRARMSCRGCWECSRPGVPCRERFLPRQVAFLAHQAVEGRLERYAGRPLADLELLRSARSEQGLYALQPLAPEGVPAARELLGRFWHQFFGWNHGLWGPQTARAAYAALAEGYPPLHEGMRRFLARLGRDLGRGLARSRRTLPPDFWLRTPPAMQPARSLCQLLLENGDFARPAWARALGLAEALLLVTDPRGPGA